MNDFPTRSTLKNLGANKVPEVTLGFWIIKILATTLGETGGDTVTMTWLKADVMVNAGYLVGSAIFLSVLIVLVIAQIVAHKFHPFLYWATIVASTTFGTTMADFATRSLGIGYTGGSLLLFTCLMVVLALWYRSEGTISVNTVSTPRVEAFYWAAITFRKPSELLSAIGSPTQAAWDTKVERWCSALDWRLLLRCITGRMCRAWGCSGPPSF